MLEDLVNMDGPFPPRVQGVCESLAAEFLINLDPGNSLVPSEANVKLGVRKPQHTGRGANLEPLFPVVEGHRANLHLYSAFRYSLHDLVHRGEAGIVPGAAAGEGVLGHGGGEGHQLVGVDAKPREARDLEILAEGADLGHGALGCLLLGDAGRVHAEGARDVGEASPASDMLQAMTCGRRTALERPWAM